MWPFSNKLLEVYDENGYDTDLLDYNDDYYFIYRQKNQPEISKKIKIKSDLRIIKIIRNRILFPYYFKQNLKKIESYQAIIILYHNNFLNNCVKILLQKTKKIILIYAGSDFYRATKCELRNNKLLLNACSKIVFTNEGMANDLTRYYNDYFSKFTINHFGLNIIDCLIANSHKIQLTDKDSIKITIGYNGASGQQHIKIIELINFVIQKADTKIKLIIPLTYAGEKKYVEEIKKVVSNLNIDAVFYERKLSEFEIAEIRKNSDIVINMQVSDQASGSLIEYLATGSIMIVADWLPYSFWDDYEFYYHKTNFENLGNTLNEILLNYLEEKERSKKNMNIALNNFSSKARLKEILSIVE